MGPGWDRACDPWLCSQTRIWCQTRYGLRYAARFLLILSHISKYSMKKYSIIIGYLKNEGRGGHIHRLFKKNGGQ